MIRVYIRITPPHVGLFYSAVCPHGTSDMHFDPVQVELLSGTEKVYALAAAHRQETHCGCLAEDEGSDGPTDYA
jgi:hypothetical protein